MNFHKSLDITGEAKLMASKKKYIYINFSTPYERLSNVLVLERRKGEKPGNGKDGDDSLIFPYHDDPDPQKKTFHHHLYFDSRRPEVLGLRYRKLNEADEFWIDCGFGWERQDEYDFRCFIINLALGLTLKVFENRQQKEQLCSQAESLSESTDWKATVEAFKDLQVEWKKIGVAGKDFDDKIWHRFKSAKDKFYQRQTQHFEKRNRELEENRNRKEKLCREAEALSYSKDWKSTREAFKRLTEQWKQIGFAGKDFEEELWQRFRTAKDKFNERQSEFYKENLQQKERLCTRAESLTYDAFMSAVYPTRSWGSGDVRDAIKRVKELQAEWKTIGPVPREEVDRVEKCFRNACDRVFKWAKEERERKQAEWRNKMQETLNRKLEQTARLKESIFHDESVLARLNDSYYNVRPGRRADEIRESIRNKISAIEDKICSKRKRLDDLEASIGDIRSKLW